MANSDSLFGGLSGGDSYNINPYGGTVDLNLGDYYSNVGFSGEPLSPHVAMMLQAGLMDPKFLDDYFIREGTGGQDTMHISEMWGKQYGKYFDPYDFKKEQDIRRSTLREKLGKRQKSARKMTGLKEAFGKQGFVSSGDQLKSTNNLYEAAVNAQVGEDISLRKDVMGMHSDWRSNMWDMMTQLASQNVFASSGGPFSEADTEWQDLGGGVWQPFYGTNTDDMSWDEFEEVEVEYGGGG